MPTAPGTVLFTSGFSIPKSCNNLPTAAAYINFWVNDHEANTLFASNNGADTNQKELQAQIDDPKLDPAMKHMLELYEEIVAKNPPTVLYPPGYQANFETAFTRAYQQISLNGANVQNTAKHVHRQPQLGVGRRPVSRLRHCLGRRRTQSAPRPIQQPPEGEETVRSMANDSTTSSRRRSDGDDGAGSDPGHGRTVLHDDPRRPRRGRHQGRASRAGDQTRRSWGRSGNGEDSRASWL